MNTRLNAPKIASLFAGVFVTTCFALAGPPVACGQGLDDLFADSADSVFDDADEDFGGSHAYSGPKEFFARPDTTSDPARARDLGPERPASNRDVASPSDLRLVNSSGSSARRMPTAMELRQQRALAESRARIARLEASYWGFRPTLRPTWSSDLTTTSRYPAVQTYFVPVYVLPR